MAPLRVRCAMSSIVIFSRALLERVYLEIDKIFTTGLYAVKFVQVLDVTKKKKESKIVKLPSVER